MPCKKYGHQTTVESDHSTSFYSVWKIPFRYRALEVLIRESPQYGPYKYLSGGLKWKGQVATCELEWSPLVSYLNYVMLWNESSEPKMINFNFPFRNSILHVFLISGLWSTLPGRYFGWVPSSYLMSSWSSSTYESLIMDFFPICEQCYKSP